MAKEVKMDSQSQGEGHKLSYEELNEAYNQLYQRATRMQRETQELGMMIASKRLDYLFKALEHFEMFNITFINKCVTEIEASLINPEEVEESKNTDTKE